MPGAEEILTLRITLEKGKFLSKPLRVLREFLATSDIK